MNAAIYRDEWERISQDMAPMVTAMDNKMADTSALNNSNSNTLNDISQVAAANARNRGRYGVSLSAPQQQAMNRSNALGAAIGKAHNYNTTAQSLKDRNQEMLKQKVGLGRGLLGLSRGNEATGQSLLDAQSMQQAQAAAQSRSSGWDTAVQILGLGARYALS